MKYEYENKYICKDCGTLHNFTEGLSDVKSDKDKEISKDKNKVCEACGGKLEFDKSIEHIVEKDKLKDKVEI
jgi:DNA-directed RNA polymerase subunit RPC12/RpoP